MEAAVLNMMIIYTECEFDLNIQIQNLTHSLKRLTSASFSMLVETSWVFIAT
jgi:hypothetical protein